MNKNVVFIILGALFAAIIVSMTVRSTFNKPADGGIAIDMVEILVASKRISIGQQIDKEDIKWQKWPKEALFKGVIEKSKQKNVEELAIYGQKVRRSIEKGEPVSLMVVIKESEGHSFLAATLGKGMRAISIPVSAASSAGGFIRPGDRVDVILTHSPRFRGDAQNYAQTTVQRYASQTILSNIKVLAVDQKSKEDGNEDDKIKPGKTVTLEVNKIGAETLALSLEMGDLILALRSLGDEDEAPNKNIKNKLMTDAMVSDVIKSVINKQKKALIGTNSIRMYSGRDAKDVIVRSSNK